MSLRHESCLPAVKPEPDLDTAFRPGLPPIALRKAWREWEDDPDRTPLWFDEVGLRYGWWQERNSSQWSIEDSTFIKAKEETGLRPRNSTWSAVELAAAKMLGTEDGLKGNGRDGAWLLGERLGYSVAATDAQLEAYLAAYEAAKS